MDIEVFCLCDGAYNYNGKLTIVGTYDQLIVESIPQKCRLAVALKLNVHPDEVSDGTKIMLSFKDSQSNQVAKDIVNTITVIPKGVDIIHLAMAVSIDLSIAEVGVHRVELSMNDTLIKKKEFLIALR